MLACLLSSPSHAQVGLKLEAGLDGIGRSGRWAPLRVTATNGGQPTTGPLQFLVPGAWTVLPLELPAGANKQVSTVLVPQAGYEQVVTPSRQVATAILRDGRKEISRAETQLRLLPAGFRLFAVCGAEGAGLRFLAGQSLANSGWSLSMEEQAQAWQNQVATAHLSPEQMPGEWAGLRAADLLLIRDTAWARLEPAQRRAVRQWVEMGNRLLLCGEDPAGFSDPEGRRLLPVQPTGRRPLPWLAAFPLPERAPIRAPGGRVMTVAAQPRAGAVVGLQEAGAPILVTRPQGFGVVVWLGFDPFRVLPPGPQAIQAFWLFLLARATGAETTPPGFPRLADVPSALQPIRTLPTFPSPSRWTLASFGLAYAILFGPINIWLLRRLRRTVRSWLLMPALSLLLTGGVLALGTAWGQGQLVFHSTSVLEAMAGTRTAQEHNLSALFSPTNSTFRLEIEDPAPLVHRLNEDGVPETASEGGVPAYANQSLNALPVAMVPEFREGDLCRWDRVGLTLWTIQLFQTERAVDLDGEIRLDLDDRLAGRVVNDTRYRLRDVYLRFGGWRCSLGEIGPGATRRVPAGLWRRRRQVQIETDAYGQQRTVYPGGTGSSPLGTPPPPGEADSNDLHEVAGSLLRGSPNRSEVVLVAHTPDLMLPIRFLEVPRSPAPGLSKDTLLLVRRPVARTARPAGKQE